MKDVSVIIVNYNGRELLRECLDSVFASEAAAGEVIVVDNASRDGSADLVRERYPGAAIIELDGNLGFAEANNVGADAARGKYLHFLNNDTIVTPRWSSELRDLLESSTQTGVAGSKLLLAGQPSKINSAGASIVFNGGGYDIGCLDDDGPRYSRPGPSGSVCAASLMVRREEFLRLGGFDSFHFMYFEDVDLCWRYWLAGFEVRYVPSSVVYHHFGGTSGTGRFTPLRAYYGARNSNLNVMKNLETRNLPWPLLFNLLWNGMKFLYLAATLRFRSAFSIAAAYGSLLGNLPLVLRKRREVQGMRRRRDRYLFEEGLVIGLPAAAGEYRRRLGRGEITVDNRR